MSEPIKYKYIMQKNFNGPKYSKEKLDAAIYRTLNYTLHDWIDVSDVFSRYECPKCAYRINGAKTNYCPNCGIPMRV